MIVGIANLGDTTKNAMWVRRRDLRVEKRSISLRWHKVSNGRVLSILIGSLCFLNLKMLILLLRLGAVVKGIATSACGECV